MFIDFGSSTYISFHFVLLFNHVPKSCDAGCCLMIRVARAHRGGGRGEYVLPFVLSVIQRVKVSLYVTSDAKGIL